MKIKICDANGKKIQALLDEVNGKAHSFTIQYAEDVFKYASSAEAELEASKLAKSERVGAFAVATPAGPSANSYKYAARSTSIRMERGSTGWFLVDVSKADVFPKQPERLRISITEDQADIIKRKSIADYVVRKASADLAKVA